MSTFDVAIIGGGIAGMAAAQSARTRGANVIIINDGTTLGGNMLGESFCPVGFTNEFGKGLPTGRDYATNLEGNCQKSWVQIMNETVVVDVLKLEFSFKLFCLSQNGGLEVTANTVVFACGCLEKGKESIFFEGRRPCGVFTAGEMQRLINKDGLTPGKVCIIYGNDSFALNIATRLRNKNVDVVGIFDEGHYKSFTRDAELAFKRKNSVPIHMGTKITRINGHQHVEGVDLCCVDKNGEAITDTSRTVACDLFITAYGFLPNTFLAKKIGLEIDQNTGGIATDQCCETSQSGIFSCGNAVYIEPDYKILTLKAQATGESTAFFSRTAKCRKKIEKTDEVLFCSPSYIDVQSLYQKFAFSFAVNVPFKNASLNLTQGKNIVFSKDIGSVMPNQTQNIFVNIDIKKLNDTENLTFSIKEEGLK